MGRQIFLSYARVDLEHAWNLYQELRVDPSVHVWFDQVDLIPGIRWRPTIRKAIRESSYFVALFSKQSSTKAGFRHTELSQALEIAKEFPDDAVYLIPVRIDPCSPPREEVEEYNITDLFPDRAHGVARICDAVGIKLGSPRSPTAKQPASVAKTRKAPSPKAGVPKANLFKIKLVSMDVHVPELKRVATGLNKAQTYFQLSHAIARPTQRALRVFNREPQLDLDRLDEPFYEQFSAMKLDYAMCITDRFVAFEENGEQHWNYLSAEAPKSDRILVSSIRGLERHAANAKVTLERALAYSIVSDLASHFLDFDYHSSIRSCPLDFVADHTAMSKGLRKRRFCKRCAKQLAKQPELERAFTAMLAW